MSKREESSKQVIIRSDRCGKTDIWEKNSANCTTKEGHRTHYHDSGMVVDHHGKKVGSSKSGGSSSSGGCFLTSACVEHMEKSDDCHELTVLRAFRDNFVLSQTNGREIVEEYYQIAPGIVEGICQRPNSGKILDEIYQSLVSPCVTLCQND